MVFLFPPQAQTNTLAVLPVTAFASSVCQHGNCLSSKQYSETWRHNQAVSHIQVGLFPAAGSWSSRWPPPLWQFLQLLDKRKYIRKYIRPTYRKHIEVGTLLKERFWKNTVRPACYLTWDLGNHTRRCIFEQTSGVFWSAGLESPVLKGGTPSASSSAAASTAGCTPASPADASSCQGNYGRCGMSHFTGCHWQGWAFPDSAVTFVSLIKTYTSHDW